MILIIELIIAMVIIGILGATTNSQIALQKVLTENLNDINKANSIKDIKDGVIQYYETNGVVPTTLEDIKDYIDITTIGYNFNKYKENYEILSNGGNTFEYNGNNTYKVAIVNKGFNNILETSIVGNKIVKDQYEDEDITGISNSTFMKTKFELGKVEEIDKELKNLLKVKKCNTALSLYIAANGTNNLSIENLIIDDAINIKDVIDEYGEEIILDTTNNVCYSKGPNMIDNNKLEDDIVE